MSAPDPQRFSVARLQSWVPEWKPPPAYPFDVLERYLGNAALDRA